jgi:hypothetical protein
MLVFGNSFSRPKNQMGTDGLHFNLSHPLMNQPPYSIPSHASTTSLSLVDPFIGYSAMFVCFHLEEKGVAGARS